MDSENAQKIQNRTKNRTKIIPTVPKSYLLVRFWYDRYDLVQKNRTKIVPKKKLCTCVPFATCIGFFLGTILVLVRFWYDFRTKTDKNRTIGKKIVPWAKNRTKIVPWHRKSYQINSTDRKSVCAKVFDIENLAISFGP